jgi:hypothetical protein
MRHDGKRQLQLYVSKDTLDLIRREAKSRKLTMSAFVTAAVGEKLGRAEHCRILLCHADELQCGCSCDKCKAASR